MSQINVRKLYEKQQGKLFMARQELLTKFSSLLSYKSWKSSQLDNEELIKFGIKLQAFAPKFSTYNGIKESVLYHKANKTI